MAFQNSSGTDARGGVFNDIRGGQTNNTFITTTPTLWLPRDNLAASTSTSGRGRTVNFAPSVQSDSDSEVYARILLTKKHGYPLWLPEPFANLPEEYQRDGVRIGDVGIITSEGAFDFLFNVCLPSQDPVNCGRVPPAFEPLELNLLQDIAIAPDMHPPGCDIASTSFRTERIDSNSESRPGIGTGLCFTCSSNEGALLVLPNGACRYNLLPLKRFRKYATRHALVWYDYVNNTLDRETPNGSLYLVTGADKASSWGVAAFSNSTEETGISLKFTVADTDYASATCQYSWERSGRAAVRTGPRRPDGHQNQCVFVRGYKIALRENFLLATFKGPVKTSYIVDSNPSDILAKGDGVARSPNFGAWPGGYNFRSSRSDGPQDQTESDSPDEVDTLIDHVPGNQLEERYHPSTIINQYLLDNNPDAVMAITHDDVWCAVIQEDDITMPKPSELIRRVLMRFQVALDAGCVYLEPGPEADVQRKNTTSEALSSQDVCSTTVDLDITADPSVVQLVHNSESVDPTFPEHVNAPDDTDKGSLQVPSSAALQDFEECMDLDDDIGHRDQTVTPISNTSFDQVTKGPNIIEGVSPKSHKWNRKVVDLIHKVSEGLYPNMDPRSPIRVGDIGKLDRDSGKLRIHGNIYNDHDASNKYGILGAETRDPADEFILMSENGTREAFSFKTRPYRELGRGGTKLSLELAANFTPKKSVVLALVQPQVTEIPLSQSSRLAKLAANKELLDMVVVDQVLTCPSYALIVTGTHGGNVTVSFDAQLPTPAGSQGMHVGGNWAITTSGGYQRSASSSTRKCYALYRLRHITRKGIKAFRGPPKSKDDDEDEDGSDIPDDAELPCYDVPWGNLDEDGDEEFSDDIDGDTLAELRRIGL